jgi:hypothetical protein
MIRIHLVAEDAKSSVRRLRNFLQIPLLLFVATAWGQEPYPARLDQFPKPKTHKYLPGELTMVDHVNRMGILRPDRSDAHNKYHWDLPHHFTMLPYGSIVFRGAPATLRDIPIGTHLHGSFHLGPKGGYRVPLLESSYFQTVKNQPNRFSPDSQYSHVLLLEDDFSFYRRQGSIWKILNIDTTKQKLITKRIHFGSGNAEGLTGKQTFDLTAATRIWKGPGVGVQGDLKPEQQILFNLTWATIYGPGRLTDIWIDEESRAATTKQQRSTHYQFQRDHGVPALIESVEHLENGAGNVIAQLYPGIDEKTLADFKLKSYGRLIVVEPNLRSHDQGNDAKPFRLNKITRLAKPPLGSSGIQVNIYVPELLEGIRPGRSIRLKAALWPRGDLPREERVSPFDIRPRFLEVKIDDAEKR